MLKIKYKCILMTIGVLLWSLVGIRQAFADFEGMDTVMTISPPSQRIILIPGEDYEGSILVSSSSSAKNDLAYSVTIGSFNYVKDENGNVDYEDIDTDTINGYNQIMEWIELKKSNGTVARGETEAIPFVIHVPKNAPAGGQYATIIVQDDTESDATGNKGVSIVSKVRFASNLVAEVAGETIDSGEILENGVPSFVMSNQLTATSLVKNDGNMHTDAEYVLQVWPLFSDEEIYTNAENPETSIIMPETERYHSKTIEGLPTVGIFRVRQTVKLFDETSITEKLVIVCPLWLLFLILFAIIALIIWIVMKIRGRKKTSSTYGE